MLIRLIKCKSGLGGCPGAATTVAVGIVETLTKWTKSGQSRVSYFLPRQICPSRLLPVIHMQFDDIGRSEHPRDRSFFPPGRNFSRPSPSIQTCPLDTVDAEPIGEESKPDLGQHISAAAVNINGHVSTRPCLWTALFSTRQKTTRHPLSCFMMTAKVLRVTCEVWTTQTSRQTVDNHFRPSGIAVRSAVSHYRPGG
jgi:hypothetical protein